MTGSLQKIHSNTRVRRETDAYTLGRFLLLVAIICCNSIGYSQVVRGTVLDQSTAKVVPFASIYFSGTTLGTTSDENGYFELNHPKDLSNPLTISSVGFYSVTLTNFLKDEKLTVELKPKIFDLPDIEVSGDKSRNIRKKYFPVFRNEFLGKKIDPKQCRIINEEDIMLQFDRNRKILKALANRPIQIQNEQLGYDISYFLDKFEFSMLDKSLIFMGNYIFTPVIARDSKQKEEFEKNRVNAYMGSRMHLFRSLWDNSFESSGFIALNIKGEPIPPKKLRIGSITSGDGVQLKVLYMLGPFGVYYKIPTRLTSMTVQNGNIIFDINGYFDPMDVVWEGYMANKRISDLLPYEYIPDTNGFEISK
jgi:hypothetical protein